MHLQLETRQEGFPNSDFESRHPECEFLEYLREKGWLLTLDRKVEATHHNDPGCGDTATTPNGIRGYQDFAAGEPPNNSEQKSICQCFHVDEFGAPEKA